MPLHRPWDSLEEQECRDLARRGRAVQAIRSSFEDRDVLLSQLPGAWVMLVPSRKVDCTSRRASLGAS